MSAEYTQPMRTFVPSYPLVKDPLRVTQVASELTTTAPFRAQTQVTQAPTSIYQPTLGVRGDGTVGAVGPAATDPVSQATNVDTLPRISFPSGVVPLGPAPLTHAPTMAEIPGYQGTPGGEATVVAGAAIEKPVPWALVIGVGAVGVLGLGIGLYALTR